MELVPNASIYCNRQNKWRTEPLKNKTIAKLIEKEIHNYARENLAIINIFIKESYTKRFRKTEKMSRISYIASSGGLLGLCMGFSFVSLAEIAYHCFLCIVLLFRKKRALFKKAQIQKRQQEKCRKKMERSSPLTISPTFRSLPTPPPPPYPSNGGRPGWGRASARSSSNLALKTILWWRPRGGGNRNPPLAEDEVLEQGLTQRIIINYRTLFPDFLGRWIYFSDLNVFVRYALYGVKLT